MAETNIEEEKQKALAALQQQVPERRYGSGYRVEDYQQQITANRQAAEQQMAAIYSYEQAVKDSRVSLDNRKIELQRKLEEINARIEKLQGNKKWKELREELRFERSTYNIELRNIERFYDQVGITYRAEDVLKYAQQKVRAYERNEKSDVTAPQSQTGVITWDKKFYPTKDPNYVPQGYTKEQVTYQNKKGELSRPTVQVPYQAGQPMYNVVKQVEQPTGKKLYSPSGAFIGYEDPYLQQSRKTTSIEQISGVPRQEVFMFGEVPIYPSKVPTVKNLPKVKGVEYAKGTSVELAPKQGDYDIYLEPYLKKEVTGFVIDVETGRKVPMTTPLTYVDPTVMGKQYERLATPDEIKYYESIGRISTEKRSELSKQYGEAKGKAGIKYYQAKQDLYYVPKGHTYKIYYQAEGGVTMIDEETSKLFSNKYIERILFGTKEMQEASPYYVRFIQEQLQEHPVKTAITVGSLYWLGRATSFGVKYAPITARAIPEAFGFMKAGKVAYQTTKVGLYGYGAYSIGKEALSKGTEVYAMAKAGVPVEEIMGMAEKKAIPTLAFLYGLKTGGKSLKPKMYSSFKGVKYNLEMTKLQPILTPDNRMILYSEYGIKGKVPAVEVYSDMPIKEFARSLGFKNRFTAMRYEKTLKPDMVISAGRTVGEGGVLYRGIAESGRKGKKLRFYTVTEGGLQEEFMPTKPVKKGRITDLTNIEQYTLKKITGGLIPTKLDVKYFRGELDTLKAFRTSGDYPKIKTKIYPSGKRRTLYSTISFLKELEDVEGKYALYKTKLGLKDITQPYARARGGVTKMTGYTKVYEPITKGIPEYTKVYQGIPRYTEPKTKQVSKLELEKGIAKIEEFKASTIDAINKRVTTNINKQVKNLELTEQKRLRAIPTYVGGLGIEKSEYYGKTTDRFDSEILTVSRRTDKLIDESITKGLSIEVTKPITKEVIRPMQRPMTKSVMKDILKPLEKTITKPIEKYIQRPVQRVVQKPVQKYIQKPIQRGFNFPSPPTPRQRTPPPHIFPRTKSKQRDNIYGDLSVELRRYGKFIPIGRAGTAREAVLLGQARAKKTLGATFRIKGLSGSERLDIDNNIFRLPKQPSREAPFTFVQRRGKRLSSYGEVEEIQLARRMKK